MLYPICSTPPSQGKAMRGELPPVVAKSLIISAFVCALLAVITLALKTHSNTLTLAFSLGGSSSLTALLLLALSKTGKRQKVSHPKQVQKKRDPNLSSKKNLKSFTDNENTAQTKGGEAIREKPPRRPRKMRQKIIEGVQSNEKDVPQPSISPEKTFQDTDLELDRSSLVASLDAWISAGKSENREDYTEAKNKILESFDNRSSSLGLLGLKIESLPDVIGQLRHLKELIPGYCPIRTLPNTLCSCTSLETLYLSYTKIPSVPDWIGQLTNLKELYVSKCPIRELPQALVRCTNLEKFYLWGTQMASLPDWIGQLINLKELSVEGCPIRAFPDPLARCTKLKRLYLKETQITSLPEWVLSLSNSLTIDVSNCPINAPFLGRLRDAMADQNYRGPRIWFSMEGVEGRSSDRPLEEVLREVCTAAGKDCLNIESLILNNQRGGADLKSWLNRLGYMADFKKGGEITKRYAELIHGAIELAIQNMNFRNVFFATISDAGTTCGDRVALSLLKLHLKYEIHTCKDPKKLADLLLKGLWTLNLLENIAQNKLDKLRISDPVETYLAYPVRLAKDIGYPLPVPRMLYFGCSGVTEDDLEVAKTMVLQRLAPKNYQEQAEFLKEQDEWQQVYQTPEILGKKQVFDQITQAITDKEGQPSENERKEQMEAYNALKEATLKATEDFLKDNFQ